MAVKLSLMAGLAAELALQGADNEADGEVLGGLAALGGITDLPAPLTIRIGASGIRDHATQELPAVRIAALTGIEVRQMGLDVAGLAGWPVGVFTHIRNTEADEARGLEAEEVTVLMLETYMDAIRVTLGSEGETCAIDRYGLHAIHLIDQDVLLEDFGNGEQARELYGRQVFLLQQTVRN